MVDTGFPGEKSEQVWQVWKSRVRPEQTEAARLHQPLRWVLALQHFRVSQEHFGARREGDSRSVGNSAEGGGACCYAH